MQRMSNQFVWSCMLQSDSLIQNRALLCMQYSFERVQCPFINVWYMFWNVPFNMKQPSIARSATLIEKINPLTAGCPVAFFEKIVAYLHARFSYKRGHIPLRKCSMILKHCAQHSFRKRVSCLPCIFDKCSIPFLQVETCNTEANTTLSLSMAQPVKIEVHLSLAAFGSIPMCQAKNNSYDIIYLQNQLF